MYPTVVPTLFVDDVSAERAAEADIMIDDLAGFTTHVSRSIVDAEMELSDVKCMCNASIDAVGK